MKIFFLTKYYKNYLDYFESHNDVKNLNFNDHQQNLFDDHFSWPSDFSEHLKTKGYKTFFSVSNYKNIQIKWSIENNVENFNTNNWEKEIVFNQIKKFKPDIIWIFAIFDFYGKFLDDINPYCKKIISWISSPYPKNVSFKNINFMVTSDEGLFFNKTNIFEKTIVTLPGFNNNILNKIKIKEKAKNLKPSIAFSGQFTIDHKIRIQYITNLLLKNYKIDMAGLVTQHPLYDIIRKFIYFFINYDFRSVIDLLKKFNEFKDFYLNTNYLKRKFVKPLFGLDYYKFLSKNDIILNIHSDDSNQYGGAQRLVEVTGIGSCLITEYKKDTKKQFNFDKEVIGYNGFEEMINKLDKINNFEIDYELIAKNGQNRTLKNHSIENMYQNVKNILS